MPIGHLSAATQVTRVNSYKSVDQDGNVAQRQVSIEVSNSAIPRYRLNAQLGWGFGDLELSWIVRYLSAVKELCSNAVVSDVQGCDSGQTFNTLRAVTYNDIQVAYVNAFAFKGLSLEAGVNNAFGVNPQSA